MNKVRSTASPSHARVTLQKEIQKGNLHWPAKVRVMEISFAPPAEVWSTNNDRNLHWTPRAKLVKACRHWSHVEFAAAKVGELPPSLVTIHLPFARNGCRDRMNYVGRVVKAVIDGMVDAGCWPDDTAEFVEICQPVLVIGGDELVRIRIQPL